MPLFDIPRARRAARQIDIIRHSGAFDGGKPSEEIIREWRDRNLRSKRAQIQLFETIAVLLVFFFIMSFGLVFYFYVARQGVMAEHTRTLELQAITTAQKVSALPELDCIQVGVHVEKCFDLMKMTSFQSYTESGKKGRDEYFDTLGYSSLTLKKILTNTGGDELIYDNPPLQASKTADPRLYESLKSNLTFQKTFLPINTYDPVSQTYGFGILEVKSYER